MLEVMQRPFSQDRSRAPQPPVARRPLCGHQCQNGEEPSIHPAGEVDLCYSAASNPEDPVLTDPDAFRGLTGNGVCKTNFWDVINADEPFYPPSVTPLDDSPNPGLPVPTLEELYIGPHGMHRVVFSPPRPYTASCTQHRALFGRSASCSRH